MFILKISTHLHAFLNVVEEMCPQKNNHDHIHFDIDNPMVWNIFYTFQQNYPETNGPNMDLQNPV